MNNLSRIRSRLGATQAVLASAIGVSQSNVSHYERGQTIPPDVAAQIIAYAKTLGHVVTFDEIYSCEATPTEPAHA
jgi:putative transcriptional regulator